jgi:hypothetical protein
VPTKEQVAGVTKDFQKRSKVPGMLMNVSFLKQFMRLGGLTDYCLLHALSA